jgi:hypothetical protein
MFALLDRAFPLPLKRLFKEHDLTFTNNFTETSQTTLQAGPPFSGIKVEVETSCHLGTPNPNPPS